MENYLNPPANENLLDDVDMDTRLVQARTGKRLINWLVDRLILYLLWHFLLSGLTGMAISFLGIYVESRATFNIAFLVFVALFNLSFLAAFESLSGGNTIAKFLTRTRAVNEDGTRISTKTAFLRSLCRYVPFEAFSALGTPSYPWHDRWTHTYVIEED